MKPAVGINNRIKWSTCGCKRGKAAKPKLRMCRSPENVSPRLAHINCSGTSTFAVIASLRSPKMEPITWNQQTALEWHHAFTEWTYLHGSQFNSVADLADTLRRLNRQMAALQRSSRMTNAQMNSRLMTLCSQMGYESMTRDLSLKASQYLFSGDERSWMSFDELVDRYVHYQSWQRREDNGVVRAQTDQDRPPRSASLEQSMNSVSVNDHGPTAGHQQAPSWDQAAPAYDDDSNGYYEQDRKHSPPESRKRPEAQKRNLQRSGTQRAFDFMARQSQMPSVPALNAPIPDDDNLAPPPPLLSPGQIKDKRSSRKSMRYDTEAFMS